MPLGKNNLGNKIRKLSEDVGLSQLYTNLCLRATCITVLDPNGFEARQIMTVSGQKSEASIRSYSRYVSDGKMREMSLAFTAHKAGSVTSKSPLPLLSSENKENVPPPTNVLLDISAQPAKSSS